MLTRFAPSPTGYLHVGNIRTALICWLYARSQNGKFLLRLDDTDLQRSDIKYIDGIMEDLKWIGIDWDASFKQSERFKRYNQVFLQLIKDERIYACYETKEELEVKRKSQLKRGLPPLYDRSALSLTAQKKNQYKQEGRSPYFRFKLDSDEIVKWDDKIKGEISILVNSISDPVVRRESGNYTYMLPSIIDDIDFHITHVVRGEDHLTNTAAQIQMIQALKAKVPIFAHLSLLHFDNNKISKRSGGLNVRSIKEDGIESMALSSYLTKLGTSDSIEAHINTQSLIGTFNIEKFSSASTQFNLNKVYQLNSKVLQKMSFDVMKERLHQIGMDSAEFWYFIRGNIDRFSGVNEWWQICKSHINPIILNEEFIKIALDMLPQGNFDKNTLSEWVKAIRQKIDIKTKDLFIQLRLALTGKEAGPELAKLLIFIGREKIITRLKKKK